MSGRVALTNIQKRSYKCTIRGHQGCHENLLVRGLEQTPMNFPQDVPHRSYTWSPHLKQIAFAQHEASPYQCCAQSPFLTQSTRHRVTLAKNESLARD